MEIEGAIPFPGDHAHSAYEPDQVERFWLALVQIVRVFHRFRLKLAVVADTLYPTGA